jgi:hypothetical protein
MFKSKTFLPHTKKGRKINPTHHPQQFMKLQFEKGAGYLI